MRRVPQSAQLYVMFRNAKAITRSELRESVGPAGEPVFLTAQMSHTSRRSFHIRIGPLSCFSRISVGKIASSLGQNPP